MAATLDELASFVPDFIKRRLERDPRPPEGPVTETFQGAIAFADITGFTPLANKLAKAGPEGAEELSRIVNAFYGELTELVTAHAGDIVAYAGDAALILWRGGDDATTAAMQGSLMCLPRCSGSTHTPWICATS